MSVRTLNGLRGNIRSLNGLGIPDNDTTYTATIPIVISGTNDISLKNINSYDNGKFLMSGTNGLSWGVPTDTSYWNEVSDPDELKFFVYPSGGINFSVLVGKTTQTNISNKFEVSGKSLLTGDIEIDGALTLKNNGATNGQLLIGNTTGNTLSLANLTQGSNGQIHTENK